ncbi:MAG: amidohydrolase family protein [Anaerolineae bacterium]
MADTLRIDAFEPRAELVAPVHEVLRARFPAIDAHNHLDPAGPPAGLLETMDAVNVRTIVNLSGDTGEALRRTMEGYEGAHPGRFVTFCNVDWAGIGERGWCDAAVRRLREDVRAGARGLKVFKELGLVVRDTAGTLVPPDDPRIADVWDAAGELGVPVLIHTADPVAFFKPLDRYNERWDELHRNPNWHFFGGDFPAFEELIGALYRTIAAHPGTTFITAHVGCYPENLAFVSQMLDTYPNMFTDMSARIAELGRAPYSARAWFLAYADRIVFGTDQGPQPPMYRTHWRFFETFDEHFPYDAAVAIQPQGRWNIYGMGLPDGVLRKVYHDNAARLLGLS